MVRFQQIHPKILLQTNLRFLSKKKAIRLALRWNWIEKVRKLCTHKVILFTHPKDKRWSIRQKLALLNQKPIFCITIWNTTHRILECYSMRKKWKKSILSIQDSFVIFKFLLPNFGKKNNWKIPENVCLIEINENDIILKVKSASVCSLILWSKDNFAESISELK